MRNLLFLAFVAILPTCKARVNAKLLADQTSDVSSKRFSSPTRKGVEVGVVFSPSKQIFCRGLCNPGDAACEAELQSLTVQELEMSVGNDSAVQMKD